MAQYIKHINLDFEAQMIHCDNFLLDNQVINLSTREEWEKYGMMADTITVRDPAKVAEAKKYAPYAQTIIILDEKGGRLYDNNHNPVPVDAYRPQRGGQIHAC